MTPVEAVEAIAAHVEASWSATSLEFVAFPGQRFDPPPGKSHVRVLIQGRPPLYTPHGGPGERITRQRGALIAQCFVSVASVDSSLPATQLAQDFRDLFHARSVGADPIDFEAANPSPIGEDGGFYQVNVTIPFAYSERH